MKKSIILTILFISLSFLLTSCAGSKNPPKYRFALFLVDENAPESKSTPYFTKDIDKVVLEKEPCLTEQDIEYYDWNTNKIKLKKPFSYDPTEMGVDLARFVLVVNDKRMYGVYARNGLSALGDPKGICIRDPREKDIIQFYDNSGNGDGMWAMKNGTIYNVLKEEKILKE